MEKINDLKNWWSPGSERENITLRNTQLYFNYLKTDAMLKKIANIFPSKCSKNCIGIYQFISIN